MKINKLIVFTAVIFVSFLMSCKKEQAQFKIPGSYKAMVMLNKAKAYPEQDIPPAGYQRAFDYNQIAFKANSTKAPVEPWDAMGPLNTSGRCLALAINPQADSTIYLGSASGGLWRSRKLGDDISWEFMPTGHNVLGVSSIAFAANDSSQMYIGTGEVYNFEVTGNDGAYRSTRGSYGVGILKSTDGGQSWTKSLDWSYQNQKGVQAIQVDINDASKVYAATTDGVYRSLNNGDDWELVLSVPMATDIEVNGQNIVAAAGNFGTADKGIYTSSDGGDSWAINTDSDLPQDFQGKIELDASTSNPNIIYASIGNGFWFNDGATWLCRSDDNGATWDLRNTEDYSRWQGWFSHDVAVHPINPDIVVPIGINIWISYDGGNTLDFQADGGVTLGTPPAGVPDGPPNYSHSDHHVVMYHPNIEDLVLFGNDGGLFKSNDGGQTFQSANGGLQTTQFYNGFSVSHQNPDFAMGGLQDNSTSIHRGDGIWQRAIGGDGSWTGINFDNDNIVYGSSQNLNVARSFNNGQGFSGMQIPTNSDNPIFIAPYQISESNPDIIYAGGTRIYKTTNQGTTWSTMNQGLPLNGDPVYAMAVSSINSDIVYAATAPEFAPASLFLTTDGGNTWDDITNNLPDRYINDIYADPTVDGKLYVVMNGFGSGHLFVSSDYGDSWTDITNGLPDVPTNAILVDPLFPTNLYVGNDLGVYYSLDGGNTWDDFTEGLYDSVVAIDLEYSPVDRKIWVATHGNGTFRRDLVSEVSNTYDDLAFANNYLNIYPNPATAGTAVNLELDILKSGNYSIQIIASNGNVVLSEVKEFTQGLNNINLELVNIPQVGTHYIKVEDDKNSRIIKTLIIQ